MKAPDIIFVHVATKPTPSITFSEIKKDDDDIEYIRKDTLLEWVKKELENAKITNFDEFRSGEVITWQRVFDKLNSM